MSEKLDRFSEVAEGYAKFRPRYPDILYTFLMSLVINHRCAWDVGTGNGQVAHALSKTFSEVIATDISASQLRHAIRARNINYRISQAESSGIEKNSIDLITAAQAAHWFDLTAFAEEVSRVSVVDGILSLWGYYLLQSEPVIDALIFQLYGDILDGFWDPNRNLINRRYQDIEFPFQEIPCPEFEIVNSYSSDDILGYLRTWSAVTKYRNARGQDPVVFIEEPLIRAFAGRRLRCHTPVFMRTWRIH